MDSFKKKEDNKCLKEVKKLEEVLAKCCDHVIFNSYYEYEINKKEKIIGLLFEIKQKLHLLNMLLKSS